MPRVYNIGFISTKQRWFILFYLKVIPTRNSLPQYFSNSIAAIFFGSNFPTFLINISQLIERSINLAGIFLRSSASVGLTPGSGL